MTKQQQNIFITSLVNICRAILTLTFLFSGFVKAMDPTGTFYKIQDYLSAFGWTWIPEWMMMPAAFMLSVVEFCIGVYLFWGIRRTISTSLVLLLLIVMTPLTLYIALKNPVSDCGCFGDALQLTNWQTFWKNILLLSCAILTFVRRRDIIRFVSDKFAWLISLYSIFFIIVFSSYCLYYLPVMDFRPFKVGADIRKGMEIPEGAKLSKLETTFIYGKNGQEQEFSIDNLPDSTWTFVKAKTIVLEKGYEPPIHDFSITLNESGEDITDSILNIKGYTFLLIAHRIEKADDGSIDLINEIYDYAQEYGYGFYALTSSPEQEIERWKDKTGAEYPFCTTDDTPLKTIIRSNPGLILIKDGTVIHKWSNNDLPDEYKLTDRIENLEIGKTTAEKRAQTLTQIFLWFIIPLLVILLVDKGYLLYKKKQSVRKQQPTENQNKTL